MGKLIYIKSIPRKSVHKIHEWSDPRSGKKLEKNKISANCRDGLSVLFSPKIGGLKTGLYTTMVTPDGKEISRQEYAEKKWNLESGYLTNRPFRRGDSTKAEDLTYFQTKVWKFNDGTTILDLDNLDDYCAYHMCLESKYVANSEKDWKMHKFPKAMFYIAHSNESEEIKNIKNRRRAQAFAKLESKALTPEWRRKLITILDISKDRTYLTEEQSYNLLSNYIENSQNHDGETQINKFLSKVDALSKKDSKLLLEAEYKLKAFVDWRLVYEKAGTYTWLSKDMIIGNTKDEAVDFILNPAKQTLVDTIQEELVIKKADSKR